MRAFIPFLVACALSACGGADPGGQGSTQSTQIAPPNSSGSSGSQPSGSSSGNSSGAVGGSSSSSSGGATSEDAGPPGSSVDDPIVPGTPVSNPTNAFSGAGNYAPNPPSIRANDQHAGGMIVTGKDCLQCHDGTTCVKFDFAGTVWQYPALTQGAADVNVRIIDANDLAYSVYSDVDGNFWHRADSDLAMPALSGVRTSDWKAIGSLNGVSCNSCHYAGNSGANAPPGPQLYVMP